MAFVRLALVFATAISFSAVKLGLFFDQQVSFCITYFTVLLRRESEIREVEVLGFDYGLRFFSVLLTTHHSILTVLHQPLVKKKEKQRNSLC